MEEKLRRYARAKGVEALYLFGSTASGRRTPLSDVDVAVLLPEHVPQEEYLEQRLGMIAELSELLGTDAVDLVILNLAPPLLVHRVITRGKLVYARDDLRRTRFEARAIQEYLDLKPLYELERRYLRERIKEGKFGVRP
jgi:hypothetical protein